MKGIVFTEFLQMVEEKFGYEVSDKIVNEAQLKSGGIYSAVGTYDHAEMVQLVTNLSQETKIAVNDLLYAYGFYFFKVAIESYPAFFKGVPDAFTFLSSIENYIHVEVLKLYPDAELPRFEIVKPNQNTLEMTYYSERRMAAFAKGLIDGSAQYFGEEITVIMDDLSGDGSVVKFTLTK